MSYRKLKIGTKVYEYTIGRKFVKIRGQEPPIPKEKCGYQMFGPSAKDPHDLWVVTPGSLKEYITEGMVKPLGCCKKHGLPIMLRCNPFDSEIYGKFKLCWVCDECYLDIRDEI